MSEDDGYYGPQPQGLRSPSQVQQGITDTIRTGPIPNIPQIHTPPPQQGGLLEFFKSLLPNFSGPGQVHEIMQQEKPGLRSEATPAQIAFPNVNGTMFPETPHGAPASYQLNAGVRG